MTTGEYWQNEVDYVSKHVSPDMPFKPQLMAALLVARQLRDITTCLDQIRAQLNQIEDQLANQ